MAIFLKESSIKKCIYFRMTVILKTEWPKFSNMRRPLFELREADSKVIIHA